jgi:hypothetical protein
MVRAQHVSQAVAHGCDSSIHDVCGLSLHAASSSHSGAYDGVQALSEAHTQVIQERELRLQHVPQSHPPLHLRHECSTHAAESGADTRPWQRNLREHTNYDAFGAKSYGLPDAQAVPALRLQYEEQASPCRRPSTCISPRQHGMVVKGQH